MASIITATTTSGLTQSADNSGVLQLASGTGNLVTVPSVTGNAVVDSATQTLTNKTLTTPNINSAQFATVSGTAPIYPCRAWVNFDGISGTTIRGSGNISSVTRSSAGRYDINFTTAMPDANYSPVAFLNGTTGTGAGSFAAVGLWGVNSLATGSVRVEYYNGGFVDSSLVFVAVFR